MTARQSQNPPSVESSPRQGFNQSPYRGGLRLGALPPEPPAGGRPPPGAAVGGTPPTSCRLPRWGSPPRLLPACPPICAKRPGGRPPGPPVVARRSQVDSGLATALPITKPLLFLLALLLLGSAGCKEKPEDAYNRMVFYAKMGNEEAFLNGFTKSSAKLVKALIALRRTYGDQVSKEADPLLSLVLDEIQEVEIEKKEFEGEGVDKIERRVATLTVAKGKVKRKIRMIEFDDGWKIDALDLQELWKDRKNFLQRN